MRKSASPQEAAVACARPSGAGDKVACTHLLQALGSVPYGFTVATLPSANLVRGCVDCGVSTLILSFVYPSSAKGFHLNLLIFRTGVFRFAPAIILFVYMVNKRVDLC